MTSYLNLHLACTIPTYVLGTKRAIVKKLLKRAKSVWNKFSQAKADVYASSTSYYFFLSITPLLIICVSLVSFTGASEQDITLFINELFPGALTDFTKSIVEEAFEQSGIALSLSGLMLFWSASRWVTALRSGLNSVFGIGETESWLLVIVKSIVAVIVIGLLFAAVIYLVFSGGVLRALSNAIPGLQEHSSTREIIDTLITLAIGVIALTAFYAYLPAGKRSFISQLPSAVCAVIACGLLSFGFKIYVDHFSNFTVLYGSLATVALFLVWMYLLFYVLLVSAFASNYFAERASKKRSQE